MIEWVPALGLSIADKEIVSTGGLLTANHISAANALMKKMFPGQNGLHDTHYLSVKQQWHSNANDFVQIIFIGSGHWACLSNKFSDTSIELFDSMHTIPTKDGTILKQACCIAKSLNQLTPSVTIDVINVQAQAGIADCGVFAISMAYDLCCGVDPFGHKVVQSDLRQHLLSCFNQKQMALFPNIPEKNKKSRTAHSFTFDIFCICRGPETIPMAMCDQCSEWFHPTCVSIPVEVFKFKNVSWKCPICKS